MLMSSSLVWVGNDVVAITGSSAGNFLSVSSGIWLVANNGFRSKSAYPHTFLTFALLSKNFLSSQAVKSFLS